MLKHNIFMPLKEDQRSSSLEKLRNFEEALTKKSEFLERKIESELRAAKRMSTTNKKGKYTTFLNAFVIYK